jgi:myo-inositol-1(or 4)-monophosphatase
MILTNSNAPQISGSQSALIAQSELHIAVGAATKAARAGREVLLHYFGRLKNIQEKHQAGLVSEADQESEKVIFETLRKYFPTDEYLGEESAGLNLTKVQPAQGSRWIVDPLDGTTNYIHRFPIFAISIGLEIKSDMQVGLIDMPALNETYVAMKGLGVWMNGRPLSVSKTEKMKDSLLATGFFSEDESILEEQLRIFSNNVRRCRGIRRAGAAAYDLTQVASGVFDAYWEKGLKPWDTAAGILMVREAGGQVTTYRGADYNPYSLTMVASNAKIHDELRLQGAPFLAASSD